VSYFFQFRDDPTIDAVGSQANIQRAAALLFSTAEFRKMVCSGQLPAEKVGKEQSPLCSTAYKYMFHACRVPRSEQDSYCIYDPSRYTHAIVARKGHFFSVELVDSESGDPLPLSWLEEQLKQCLDMADTISSARPKLGLLTTSNRDAWADAREQLLSAGGIEMEEALEKLQSGAVLVNLDDESPVAREECGELLLSGGLTSGENRWFDKSIQLIVTKNGKAGFLGEHSMMDGMPLVNYANYITNSSYADAKNRSRAARGKSPKPSDIFGGVLSKIDQGIIDDLLSKGKIP
jgi:carnitine O-acetyltransferase